MVYHDAELLPGALGVRLIAAIAILRLEAARTRLGVPLAATPRVVHVFNQARRALDEAVFAAHDWDQSPPDEPLQSALIDLELQRRVWRGLGRRPCPTRPRGIAGRPRQMLR